LTVPRRDTLVEVSAKNLQNGIPARIIPRVLSCTEIISKAHGNPFIPRNFLFDFRLSRGEKQYAEDMISGKKKVLGLGYEM